MLTGRDDSWARVEALLTAAAAGRGGVLALIGEPGSGKTALVDAALGRLDDGAHWIVRLRPGPSEARLRGAGLHDLVRGLADRGTASEAADRVTAASDDGADLLTVAQALLELVAATAADHPDGLVVAVDDAHHLDPWSAEVVEFCARRADSRPVAWLLAARTPLGEPLPSPTMPTCVLAPLDAADTASLLAELIGERVGASVGAGVHALTGGNVQAIHDVATLLATGTRIRDVRLDASSSAVARFRDALAADAELVTLLRVVARAGRDRAADVRRALGELGVGTARLDRAVAAGLVALDDHRVRILHPLVAAAVASLPATDEDRAVHATLAAVVHDPGRCAWHLAHTTDDPDEHLATQLVTVARDLEREGAHLDAAAAWERAARLSATPDAAALRWYGAARGRHLAGDLAGADDLYQRALPHAPDRVHADVQQQRGHVLIWRGRAREGFSLLTAEARRRETTDPTGAATMLMQALVGSLQAGALEESLDGARVCAEVGARAGGPVATATGALYGFTRLLTGDPDGELLVLGAADLFEEVEPLVERLPMTLMLTSFVGQMLVLIEAFDEADAMLSRTIGAALRLDAPTLLAMPLAHHSDLALRQGQLGAAASRAQESLDVARTSGEDRHRAIALAALAAADARRGEHETAASALDEATDIASEQSLTMVLLQADAVRGLSALARGEPELALEAHERLGRRTAYEPLHHPGVATWQGDHVEALVRLGEHDRAATVLDSFEAAATTMRGYVPRAIAERCRAMLADGGADEHFERALKLHDRVRAPFEHARTELCYGERLRRDNRPRDARPHLRRALAAFDAIGAPDWSARAREELRASGARPAGDPARGDDLAAVLTPQEQRIVALVASGRTNREVAAELYLSPKTIENHLGRIYAKLGVRRRTDLARLAADQLRAK